MTEKLKIGNIEIPANEIIPLLASYQMLPTLWREMIIDRAIADVECTNEEKAAAIKQFCEKNQITSQAQYQAWFEFFGISLDRAESVATRELRIEKFKQETWKNKIESYFLSRKAQLDKVIYSLIRTADVGIAQEIYFRLSEGEQSFAQLAREYSQGPEAQTGGLIGPVELSTPHPTLAKLLSMNPIGQVSTPVRLGEWLVIVRLDKFIPAQLDEPMRQRLLNELFAAWLQEQFQEARASASLQLT